MLHVRVDDALKAQAADALAQSGLTLSDAVRILLTRIAAEGGLPAGLTTSAEAHGLWLRAKVLEALDSLGTTSATPQADVMAQARAIIAQKRRA
jgi:DNA-damage-inducible protein J